MGVGVCMCCTYVLCDVYAVWVWGDIRCMYMLCGYGNVYGVCICCMGMGMYLLYACVVCMYCMMDLLYGYEN